MKQDEGLTEFCQENALVIASTLFQHVHGFDSGSGRSSGVGNGNHSNILAWEIPWREEPGGL